MDHLWISYFIYIYIKTIAKQIQLYI